MRKRLPLGWWIASISLLISPLLASPVLAPTLHLLGNRGPVFSINAGDQQTGVATSH